jgi:invasion protein IalB
MEQSARNGAFELVLRGGWLAGDGEPAMLIALSPAIAEGEGILVRVDGKARAAPAVDRCDGERCFAYLRLDETVLPAFVRGRRAEFSFPDTEGHLVEIPISLLGFTKAYLTQRRG